MDLVLQIDEADNVHLSFYLVYYFHLFFMRNSSSPPVDPNAVWHFVDFAANEVFTLYFWANYIPGGNPVVQIISNMIFQLASLSMESSVILDSIEIIC
jgi:hypothetical protein